MSKPPVQIDIGAKAEAKFELKAEVPSSSVGRLVDALTDLFRPFSEARGLRADQIRLQRAEVAVEIAKIARKAIEEEKLETHSVRNKVLIPLIEKSSNESLSDDFMIQRWADLLVSASQQDGVPPLYVQILSEIDGRQAEALINLATNEYRDWYLPYTVFADSFLETDASSIGWVRSRMANVIFSSKKNFYGFLVDYFSRPGCYLYHVDEFDEHEISYHLRSHGVNYKSGMEREFEICNAVGLVKREATNFSYRTRDGEYSSNIIYFRLTEIGVEFLENCARDTMKLLRNRQEEMDTEYKATKEYKSGSRANRRVVRSRHSKGAIL